MDYKVYIICSVYFRLYDLVNINCLLNQKNSPDLVAYPITEILNVSYAEQGIPTIWKMADVTPLPKKKQWLTSKRN